MKKIIMTKGLPASGKSTWAKIKVKESNGTIKRVNKDDLRAMIDAGEWSRDREKNILATRDSLVEMWLTKDYSVIVDDTNLSPNHEIALKAMAKKYGADFEIQDFSSVPVTECMKRDGARPNPVGDKVIMRMYYESMFDYYHWITPVLESKPFAEKSNAIIVDIDGTMAIHNGRSPHDLTRVKEDLFNEKLWAMLKALPYTILFTSGREGTQQCRKDTVEWMNEHTNNATASMKYKFLFREEGDNRADTIIKQEIYEGIIEPMYNVVAIYDDRDAVVQMWRSLGLFTCQVNYGAF